MHAMGSVPEREVLVMPRVSRGFGQRSLLAAVLFLLVFGVALLAPQESQALPSYARQTGLGCGVCHTEFPQLTPFGRRFKIGGYTLRKTEEKRIDAAPGTPDWELPFSAQTIVSFTHTATDMDTAGSAPYLKANNNLEFESASLFYGGAITDHIGAYIQGTYNAQGFGPPNAHLFTWDNLDVRYANTTNIGGMPLVYGITANNNPTVQDPWNSTPAWGYPFVATSLAPKPAAATLIEGGLAQQVLGVTAY